jgi:hypothetical protein
MILLSARGFSAFNHHMSDGLGRNADDIIKSMENLFSYDALTKTGGRPLASGHESVTRLPSPRKRARRERNQLDVRRGQSL